MNQEEKGGVHLLSVRHALATILPLALLSFLIAAIVLSCVNDMYAFVKEDKDISLYVGTPCSLPDFSERLSNEGIIDNPLLFYLYALSKDKRDTVEQFSGELRLNSNFSYRQLLYAIQSY